MGVLPAKKSLVQCDKLATAAFCRRRLSVVSGVRIYGEWAMGCSSRHGVGAAGHGVSGGALAACWRIGQAQPPP